MGFVSLADELRTDPTLKALDQSQMESVIHLLALAMHADGHASYMEKMEFTDLVYKLPGFEGKGEFVEKVTEEANKAAQAATDDKAVKKIARSAAKSIKDAGARKTIFKMVATMVMVDLQLTSGESRVINALAEAFDIDNVQEVLDSVS